MSVGGTYELVIEQHCRLPAQLPVEQAASLDRERVVVSHQQAADPEEGVCGVSQGQRLVGHAVKHTHFVPL